jgi:hypothetical protein
MRRRAAFYLFLGLTTALLIVALATGLQTGGSRDPNAWMWAQRHIPLLQIIDLAAVFLFVVIGLYGLTVSRLQVQLQHQAEDFGDQMQTLLHRNEELAKVNDEYAEQIAALEFPPEEHPALSLGDSGQRVISALHWQVDAQAQQLEAVHRALEHQQSALEALQQQVQHSLGERRAAPSLHEGPISPQLAEASSPATANPKADALEFVESPPAGSDNGNVGIADWTVNGRSTLIGEMLDFDVGAFASAEAAPAQSPHTIKLSEGRTYPVDDSMLAVAAGHLSSMPYAAPAPPPERIEISVGKVAEAPLSAEPFTEGSDPAPYRTQGALALDIAESALSSLHSETQEALSSLLAEVEATIPQATPAPLAEPEKSTQPARRKPWHLRF